MTHLLTLWRGAGVGRSFTLYSFFVVGVKVGIVQAMIGCVLDVVVAGIDVGVVADIHGDAVAGIVETAALWDKSRLS